MEKTNFNLLFNVYSVYSYLPSAIVKLIHRRIPIIVETKHIKLKLSDSVGLKKAYLNGNIYTKIIIKYATILLTPNFKYS